MGFSSNYFGCQDLFPWPDFWHGADHQAGEECHCQGAKICKEIIQQSGETEQTDQAAQTEHNDYDEIIG